MTKTAGEMLIQYAHGRTDDVRKKLREAMKAIDLDIEKNEGIYPFQ